MTPTNQLQALRQQIDALDNQILTLLQQRTGIVLQVADLKKQNWPDASFMRPGREAQIIQRLLAQADNSIPPALLVTLWRDLMMASLQQEQAFQVAVYVPQNDLRWWSAARDHFGAATLLLPFDTTTAVLRAVREGKAMLGVLPSMEEDSIAAPWWPALRFNTTPATPVVFRLPVLKASGTFTAYAIGTVPLEPSGDDITVLVLETSTPVSRQTVADTFTAAGLPALAVHRWYEQDRNAGAVFWVEIAGHVTEQNKHLTIITEKLGCAGCKVAGLYARQV